MPKATVPPSCPVLNQLNGLKPQTVSSASRVTTVSSAESTSRTGEA